MTYNPSSTLQVDIRLFGRIITDKEGVVVTTVFIVFFYALLERFLRYGPVGVKKGKKMRRNVWNPSYEDREISVENLVLEFRSAQTGPPFPPIISDTKRGRGNIKADVSRVVSR
ncbi:uncharacterized protein N7479_011260 [Penicillium vulpinum]|uniref:uncharacterized protein n=1 Tax=Penicillium vulpinum TaxID=29845 RepID=UPI0025471E81|nr:uncharacterized protein N7479_011260 [Penicillium vulpinum]KAJ5952847.1 hypothetical protein N7479_011260 [Penicillium vulpinum]